MAYPGLAHEEHKYLGKEYCSGYMDVYGKWNTGFYCPQYGSKTAVFCCGTAVFKYCCTNQEPVENSGGSGVLLDGDDPDFDGPGHPHHGVSSAVFVRVPIVFGVVCGIAAVLVLLIVAACYFCSCCFAYKKRRNDLIGDTHHRLHLNHHPQEGLYRNGVAGNGIGNSTASNNLLNLYSSGGAGHLNGNSLVTTPLDLDWTGSIASSYQSQQQLYAPLQFPPGSHISPALSPAAAAIAAALSQRNNHNPAGSSLLYGTTGINTRPTAPSIISGNSVASTQSGRLPVSPAYQSLLNSSTSTLSSTLPMSSVTGTPQQHQHLTRGNLQQGSTAAASIVSSYLASLQQAQSQMQTHHNFAEPQLTTTTTATANPPPRHPSPPPSYFQSVSSASSTYQNRNSTRTSNVNNSSAPSNNRQNRMATIQSILGGSGTGSNGNYSSFNLNNDEDLLLADFLIRHESTLRRTLGLSNNPTLSNNNNRNANSTANNTNNNRSHNRSHNNPMLSQRELVDLLLRLTCNNANHSHHTLLSNSSTSSSISRSDSRAGSDANSVASSVATSRSSTSSNKSPNVISNSSSSSNKLTISEVDEDNPDSLNDGNVPKPIAGTNSNLNTDGKLTASLDLALSRLSVENDSGVASSTCSTVGSDGAESMMMSSIKIISRDLSEDTIKMKKQHALDDEGTGCIGGDVHHHHKIHEQQLAATIHPETNCKGKADEDSGADGEIMAIEPSSNTVSGDCNNDLHHQDKSTDSEVGGSAIFAATSSLEQVSSSLPCETT